MEGVIILNKPIGLSSHDCVNKVRKILNTKRVGHAGTLDPMAEGVLVIGVNDALKAFEFLEMDDKEYQFTVCFGKSTTTYDSEGEIVDEIINPDIDLSLVDKALLSFIGNIKQMPPIYSAIKRNGKPLYKYALENKEVIVEERNVTIYDFKRISGLVKDDKYSYIEFSAHVSKGTYIRSLAYDLGKIINIPSSIIKLKRVRSGKFNIEKAVSLDDLEVGNFSMLNIVDFLPFTVIDDSKNEVLFKRINNGMKINKKDLNINDETICLVNNGNIHAVYKIDEEINGFYKPLKVWMR